MWICVFIDIVLTLMSNISDINVSTTIINIQIYIAILVVLLTVSI